MKKYIIIVAGGSGTRMNSVVPKQFIELQGKPMLMHTIEKFVIAIPEITVIVVLAKQFQDEWKKLCKTHHFKHQIQLVNGGETRFHSVKNGLALVPDACVVGVHDAARPFVNSDIIIDAYKVAEKKGNAIPAVPFNESIRKVENGTNKAVERSKYVVIQTPQCFHSTLLKNAFLQEYRSGFTDDASVLEGIGEKINLIEGHRENVKITTSEDLLIAEGMMKNLTDEAQRRK